MKEIMSSYGNVGFNDLVTSVLNMAVQKQNCDLLILQLYPFSFIHTPKQKCPFCLQEQSVTPIGLCAMLQNSCV